jgi:hypothetical protein
MKKILSVISILVFLLSFAPDTQAKGRTGSIRVGGYNSHGKGSRYFGGHVRH